LPEDWRAGRDPQLQRAKVEWLPEDWRAGRDPQLQRAIETVLRLIVDNPPAEVKRPEYPVHR
jgi:hypothetical protein